MSCDIFDEQKTGDRWVEPDENQRGDWSDVPRFRTTTPEVFDFGQVVEDRIESIRSVLFSKAKEYATGSDRFHNFNVAARIASTTPESALMGMRLKHEVSVMDLVEIAASRPLDLTEGMVEEKIGDDICYLILLEGLFKKRIFDQNAEAKKRNE